MYYYHLTQEHGLKQFKSGAVSPPISSTDLEQPRKMSISRAILRYGELKRTAMIC